MKEYLFMVLLSPSFLVFLLGILAYLCTINVKRVKETRKRKIEKKNLLIEFKYKIAGYSNDAFIQFILNYNEENEEIKPIIQKAGSAEVENIIINEYYGRRYAILDLIQELKEKESKEWENQLKKN